MQTIITHDRMFHADETTAVAILRMLQPDVAVVRTRDPQIIREGIQDPETLLLDIGGAYEPAQGLFDHHQLAGAGFRDVESKEWPFATAGLIWRHFGSDVIRRLHPALLPDEVDEVAQHLDDLLIKYVDASDCGVRLRTAGPSFSALISSFNPSLPTEEASEDAAFFLVVDLVQVIVTNFISRYVGKVLARAEVRAATRCAGGRVLVLDACKPWASLVAEEMPDVLCAIYPMTAEPGSQWQLRVAITPDNKPRMLLPPDWAGLQHRALSAVVGTSGAIFCHRARYLAGAETFEDIWNMAQAALAYHDAQACALAA